MKNRRLNWLVLIVETIIILWVINGIYDCPCALRTCSMKHYTNGVLAWEAKNLDCGYVQAYLKVEKDSAEGWRMVIYNETNETFYGNGNI